MTRPAIDMIGKVVGRLTVLSRADKFTGKGAYWNCVCACGKFVVTYGGALRAGATRSCGCLSAATAESLAQRKEAARICARKWYAQNTKRARANSRRAQVLHRTKDPNYAYSFDLRRKYGITFAEYSRRLLQQGGVCALCHLPPINGQRLVVDHDHVLGRIRGLLHRTCNVGLGLFKDNLQLLEAAVSYLRNI